MIPNPSAFSLSSDKPADSSSGMTLLPATVDAQPVAWLVVDPNGQSVHVAGWRAAAHEHINDAINEYDMTEAKAWRVVPVYAAPHPRRPLTDKQIGDLFQAARNAKLGDGQDNSKHRLSVVEIARAVERAHGIDE